MGRNESIGSLPPTEVARNDDLSNIITGRTRFGQMRGIETKNKN